MKAVMLVAGKSTRTYPLTITRPKPLLKLLDKTIIEYNLDQLIWLVDEVILVVGYKKEMIIDYLWENYSWIKISYIEQKEQLWTWHALQICADELKDESHFIVMNWDDLYSKIDIQELLKNECGMLAKQVDHPERFWALELKEDYLVEISEKTPNPKSNLVNIWFYVFPNEVLGVLDTMKLSERWEYELTDAVSALTKNIPVKVVAVTDYWIPVWYPWNLLEANVFFLRKFKNFKIHWEVEGNVTIKWDVYLGKWSIIKWSSYIEWPVYIWENCVIGPQAHIRPDTIIWNNSTVWKTEMVDTVAMDNFKAKHFGYVGHSVIWENVEVGAWTIITDFRLDRQPHKTYVKWKKIETWRRKLWTFVWDNNYLAAGTLTYPWRKIWPEQNTMPNEIVDKDKTGLY